MLVIFDTVNIYYIPQYLPIIKVLISRGHQIKLVCYRNKNKINDFEKIVEKLELEHVFVNDDKEAAELYSQLNPEWIFFGKSFKCLGQLNPKSKTAQLGHGIGPKPSYYRKSITPMTVRFIEGQLRLKKIQKLFPNNNFVQVGFSKLDPIFNQQEPGLNYKKLSLNTDRPTILYAPTFNPSSLERFPDNWPNDFQQYNILIKPHTFTYTREQYKKQRIKLAKWKEYANVYVAEEKDLSLLPFMKDADILLSEASSTLFEFVALDKPVIVCDFYKLKWSYRGPLKYRFEQRFGQDNIVYKDIGKHVKQYKQLIKAIPEQLSNLDAYKEHRKNYTHNHVGETDGQASLRIVEYIENYK